MTNHSRVQGIFFDVGRVLVHFDHMKACDQFAKKVREPFSPEQIFKLLYGGELEDRFERGLDSALFCANVREKLRCPNLGNGDIITIWGNVFTPVVGMQKLVEELAARVSFCGIISNTTAPHWEWIKQTMPGILDRIPRDNRVLSFEVKSRKPERDISVAAFGVAGHAPYSLSPDQLLLIDDKKENRDAWRACGGLAHHFDARNMTVDVLRAQLKEKYNL